MSYIGTQPTPQSLESRQEFTATASQTTFATNGYTVGYVDVYLNGVKLSTSDFTATNGSDIVLGSGAAAGDVLAVVMKNDHSDLVALPITDSAGNNVLSESGGTATLTNVTLGSEVVFPANHAGVKAALNASGSAPIYACRAWINFNGVSNVIRAHGNVSSLTDNGNNGDYTVTFATPMPDANYSAIGMSLDVDYGAVTFIYGIEASYTASSFRVQIRSNYTGQPALKDPAIVSLAVFR